MAFSTSVSGQIVTGLTTPSYTLSPDIPPALNAKQWLVSALGGTQTGVTAHSVSFPFTVTIFRPLVPKQAPFPNRATGIIVNNPVNTYKRIVRKGGFYNTSVTQLGTMVSVDTITIPANMDAVDKPDIAAFFSMKGGFDYGNAQAFYDMTVSGLLS